MNSRQTFLYHTFNLWSRCLSDFLFLIFAPLGLLLTGYYILGLVMGVLIAYLFYDKVCISLDNLSRHLNGSSAIELTAKEFVDNINKVIIPWSNVRSFELIHRSGSAFIVFYLVDRSVHSSRLKDRFMRSLFKVLPDIIPIQVEISLVKGKNHDIYEKAIYVFDNYKNKARTHEMDIV